MSDSNCVSWVLALQPCGTPSYDPFIFLYNTPGKVIAIKAYMLIFFIAVPFDGDKVPLLDGEFLFYLGDFLGHLVVVIERFLFACHSQ